MRLTISNTGPSIGPEELDKLEERLRYELPVAYRRFLLVTNGGRPTPDHYPIMDNFDVPFSDIQMLFSVRGRMDRDDLEAVFYDVRNSIPSGFLPVGHSSTNDLLCVSLRGEDHGAVYFWDSWEETTADPVSRSGFSNLYFVAEDFDAFLRALKPYEAFTSSA